MIFSDRLLTLAVGTVLLTASACASNDAATRDDAPAASEPIQPVERPEESSTTQRPPADAPAEEPAAPAENPPTATPAPTPAPAPAAASPGEADLRRSKDGIDDDTPLPAPGSVARDAFDQATQTARTNPAAAVSAYANAAQKTKYFYAAYFNAGTAAEAAGDAGNAEKYYREALKVRPDYGYALTNLYLLLRNLGRQGEADTVVDTALRQHPNKAGPHVAAAMRHYVNRRRADVKKEALQAIRFDERQVPAMQLMAAVFYEERRYETARFALENALRLEPGNALLHLELGHVLLRLEEEKRAMNEFQIALTLRDDVAEAQENFGILALANGDAEAASRAFERAAQLKPRSATSQLHLGNGLRALKRYPEALAAYQRAIDLDPNLHQVHFNLAIMHLDNELPGMDYLTRLEKAKAEFALFRDRGTLTDDLITRIEDYEKTLDKRIRREKKRARRDAERKAEEAAKAAEEAANPPPPAEPAATDDAAPADAAGDAPADDAAAKTDEGNQSAANRVDTSDMGDVK